MNRELLKAQLHLVDSIDDILDLKNWVGERRDWLGVDIETTGLILGRDEIRMVQLGDERHGWSIPWHKYAGVAHELLGAYDRRMVAHNSLFDLKHLAWNGIDLPQHLVHDSMIMAHIVNPAIAIGLKPVTKRVFGPWAVAGQALLDDGMKKQGWTWATVPYDFEPYWAYSALDTVLTSALANEYWPKIQSQRYIYDIEMACIHCLKRAEMNGVMLDLDYVYKTTAELQQEMDEANASLQVLGIVPNLITNIGSDAQVIAYMQRMGARLWRLTDKGNLSCDDDVLKEQEEAGIPGIEWIRKWRNARWLENNYFKNFRNMHVGGVIRPSVKPVAAVTGRMSIVQPALQTIPRGTRVRDAFVAREGSSLISTDYDQLELRVLADGAHEEAMLEAIRRGEDMHDFVATSLYGPNFTKQQRQICKNGQFAIVYGAGIDKFAATAGIPVPKAQEFFDMYGNMFPGVQQFMNNMIAQARQHGYVDTKFGRRIPVDSDKAYVAVNYYCQPTATADLIKLKIVELDNAGLGEFFRLPIHDEVIVEAPDDIVDEVQHAVSDVMTETQLFDCPLTASGVVVKRWGDKARLED